MKEKRRNITNLLTCECKKSAQHKINFAYSQVNNKTVNVHLTHMTLATNMANEHATQLQKERRKKATKKKKTQKQIIHT